MANPDTIPASIQTLKNKGYSDHEIRNIQFSVAAGDNRRATALFNAARDLPFKPKPMKAAPKTPTQKAAPLAPTNTLISQLKMGQGGARPAKGKTTPTKSRDLIKTSSYIDPITSTMSAIPHGSSLNLA